MEFAEGQRFDLLDEWIDDLMQGSAHRHRHEKMGRRASMEALTNMAEKERLEDDVKMHNIDEPIEHIRMRASMEALTNMAETQGLEGDVNWDNIDKRIEMLILLTKSTGLYILHTLILIASGLHLVNE